jgi:hypothetical protein
MGVKMKYLLGIILIIVSVALGLIAALNLVALLENVISGNIDAIYVLKRIAIAFICGFFSIKSFTSGKNKFSNKNEPVDNI